MTKKEAKDAGLVAMTVDERPLFRIMTTEGELLWSKWCQREVERLREKGRKAEVVVDATAEGEGWSVWVSALPPPPPPQAPKLE